MSELVKKILKENSKKLYTTKELESIQDINVMSANTIFGAKENDLFYLTSLNINEIKENNLDLRWYIKRDMDEDVNIIEKLMGLYEKGIKINPIIVDVDNSIMDGIHRYVAQKELKYTVIKVFKKCKTNI